MTRFGSGLTVRYATVEEFTTEFVERRPARDTGAFKERFRGVDVLLLDDVQFLADKARTEEELFHTFNALRDSGRQLVMTSRPQPRRAGGPRGAAGRAVRLRARGGVEPPDLPVRRAILEKRARLDAVDARPGAARRDRRPRGQQRARARGRADPGRRLRLAARRGRRRPSWRGGCSSACGRHRPPSPAPSRPSSTRPRASSGSSPMSCWPAIAGRRSRGRARSRCTSPRELTDQSLPEIGRGFGGRDHSTVLLRGTQRRHGRSATIPSSR